MSEILHKFTRSIPDWRPRIDPVKLDEANSDQLEALQITPSNTKVSDYVLTLAHDVESLKVRSPLFNAIMYDKGGMSRSEREIGAIGASIVNRCIYCASVHASRHAQLTKSDEVTDKIFADGENAKLSARDAAILKFSVKLSDSPSRADKDDFNELKTVGLNEEEILDLILSTSLFGWANRLMHVLGDPVRPTVHGD